MKAKITKGKNFRDIVNYIFSPGDKNQPERANWIGGTLASNNAQGLIREFNTVLRLRPHIEKPSWHCSLTLPRGEHLSDADWESVVEDFMEKMEFSEHTPYTIVRHNDTEFDHVHVVASRIPMTGPVWTGKNDVFKAIAATQELEKEYNLTQTPGYRKRESARVTYRERKKAERTGVTPPRIQLQELIDEAVADKPTAPEFAQRLEDKGVIVRANVASTGRMNGFSFELDGLAFKGSKLGKAYGWGDLQKRGVSYEAERDAAELERYRLPVEERWRSLAAAISPHQRQTDEALTSVPIKTVEANPQQVFQESPTPRTAPTVKDSTDTDTTEAARLEAAIDFFEEMFNDTIAQGQSRTRAKFNASKTPPKAQPASAEAAPEITSPEVTQPLIESSALSETPLTEAAPSPTQQPEEIQPSIEPNQQQQWVDALAPDFVELLIYIQKSELKGKRRTVIWDSEQQRLTVRENKTQKIVMNAEWDGERWQDNSSTLSHADFDEIRQALDEWRTDRDREQEQERQQRSASKGLER